MPDNFSKFVNAADARGELFRDSSLADLLLYVAEGQKRIKLVELLLRSSASIVSDAIDRMVQEDPLLISIGGDCYPKSRMETCVREAHIILRIIYHTLMTDSTLIQNQFSHYIKETYTAENVPTHSLTKAIHFIKSTTLAFVQKKFEDDSSTLVGELGSYFDLILIILDNFIQHNEDEEKTDRVLELMTELHLTDSLTRRLKDLLERLSEMLDGSKEYVRLWLTSPNPAFGGKSPQFYLEQGKIEVVEALVTAIETGQIG